MPKSSKTCSTVNHSTRIEPISRRKKAEIIDMLNAERKKVRASESARKELSCAVQSQKAEIESRKQEVKLWKLMYESSRTCVDSLLTSLKAMNQLSGILNAEIKKLYTDKP